MGVGRVDFFEDEAAPRATVLVPAVSVFVPDADGRLLLIRRADTGRYALPGGVQEPGETLTQAAIREVWEETGISVAVTGLVGVYSDPRHVIRYADGEVRQEFSVCFRARPTGGELVYSDEATDVRWVPPEHLDALDIHPTMRLRINHALAPRHEPFYT